jgi:protein ImuA
METHRRGVLDELRKKITRLETIRRPAEARPVASGIEPLDRLLGGQGFPQGALVEWFDQGGGAAATTLAMLAAPSAYADGRAFVVLDERGEFYPPEALRWGVELDQLIVVRAAGRAEIVWAGREVLASPAVGAMLAWPERIAGRDFRRLQLAAEAGGGLGLLVRPAARRADPSWAEVRLLVEPLSGGGELRRRLRIHVLRARGVVDEPGVDVEIDEQTCRVYPLAQLVHPAAAPRPARAS